MMKRWRKVFCQILAVIAAAVLLFVVVYPYTPTPIALSISKTLIAAVVLLHTSVVMLGISISPNRTVFLDRTVFRLRYSLDIIDSTCSRLR
jgi:hypothetical protein